MRKLVVTTFMTLDGVMQSPGGPDEDPEGGFEHGGWSVNYFDDAVMQEMGEFMGKPFDLLLGRRTYELFAAHWPNASEEEGAKPINEATKYVASRTLRSVDWQNSQILEDDVADAIASLKQEDGPELQVHGSGHLVQTLLRNGLIDEFHLLIFPLVLGKGKRLFEGGTVPSGLELIDHKVSSSGVMMATYRSSGEVVTGEFAVARA